MEECTMTTEKKDFTTQGKVVRLLVGQNGPYGIELDNKIVLRKSQFGTIVDLTGINEGDYVEAVYYESRDKAYAKAVRMVAARLSARTCIWAMTAYSSRKPMRSRARAALLTPPGMPRFRKSRSAGAARKSPGPSSRPKKTSIG